MIIQAAAIVFDLDGVLADSKRSIHVAWRAWCEERDIDIQRILAVAPGRRAKDTIGMVAPHLDAEAEARRLIALAFAQIDLVTPIPGAGDFVATIAGSSWAVATSGEREIAVARLTKVSIPVPPVLVSAEDVRNGKPDPEPYRTAAARLGVSPEKCVVFEDAPAGIASARAAGMIAVALASSQNEREMHGAAAIVRDFSGVSFANNLIEIADPV